MTLESRFLPVLVCVVVATLGWILGEVPMVESFEAKAVDYMQRLEYYLRGPLKPEDIVIIAIDDRSVDPESSLFSDIWGKGGWVNRENWVFHLQFQKDFFKPKVLAFDILFPASKYKPLSERAEQLAKAFELRSASLTKQKLYEVESKGNDSVAQLFWDMHDERAAGLESPEVILSIFFPEDRLGQERLSQNWNRDQMEAFALPGRVVENPAALGSFSSALLPVDQFMDAPVQLAAINTPRDRGGMVRRVPMVYRLASEGQEDLFIPSLSLMAFLRYLDVDHHALSPLGEGVPGLKIKPGDQLVLDLGEERFRVPLDAQGNLVLRSRFRYRDIEKFGFADVTERGLAMEELSGASLRQRSEVQKLIDEQLKGRLAFIAQTFTGGTDIGNFPLEDNVPNVMAHAMAVQNLLRSDAMVSPGITRRGLVCFLVAGIFWGVWEWLRYRGKNYLPVPFVLLILLIPLVCFTLFTTYSYLVEMLIPTGIALLLTTLQTTYGYALEAKRRQELKEYFSAAVSPEILKIMEENRGDISLEGARMEATVLFSDVAGFTTISERLEPQQLAKLLNRYLTPMTDVILSTKGFVDKYEGDAIMAEWGVPLADPDHARNACRAALWQLEELDKLNSKIEDEAGVRLAVRMGINSGQVSAGNMGSKRRIQYTVMGDTVNLAARLEPANKEYGSQVIIGEKTYALLPEGEFATRLLDKIIVKGKTEPVDIYELIYPVTQAGEWVADYEAGLRAMWSREWDRSEMNFRKCLEAYPRDLACKNMLRRLLTLRADPPSEEWNGAYIRTSKD